MRNYSRKIQPDHTENEDDLEMIPVIGLIVFGIAMSLGSALLWPMVLLVCDTKHHATAIGLSSCIDNGGQATSFLIVGALTIGNGEEQGQYRNVTIWLLVLAVLMLILTMLLWCGDDELNRKQTVKQREAKIMRSRTKIQFPCNRTMRIMIVSLKCLLIVMVKG